MPKAGKLKSEESYSGFLRSLRFMGIALIDSRFLLDREKYFEDQEERIFSDLSCEISEMKGSHFELKAKMVLQSARGKGQQGSLILDATYLLHFHTRGRAVRDLVAKFAEGEARIVVWPYLREYVSGMCGRGHIPPITLPMAVNEPRTT
jgi:preprotein translocase subunit SecB